MITLTPEQIYNLFCHRKDVFAVQSSNGAYFPVKRDITLQDIQDHLDGKVTLGVYCLEKDNTVRWACIDLDGTDLATLEHDADNIYNIFPDFNRMKEFSGRRGYHVWLFFDKPEQALYIQTLIKARLNKLFVVNKFEVFPKQTELNEGRLYGNLVKVPLGLHLKSGKRSIIMSIDKAGGIK